MITVVPIFPPAKPSPRPQLNLETLPPDGLISQYGVCAGGEPVLDQYDDGFMEKIELWKNSVKKLNPGEV